MHTRNSLIKAIAEHLEEQEDAMTAAGCCCGDAYDDETHLGHANSLLLEAKRLLK